MSSFERWSVWITSLLVTLTGVVYLWMKYLLPEPGGFSVVRHPLQPLVLKLHILTAPLLLLALGSIAVRHISRHLAAATRQGRFSGVSALAGAVPMVLTGYLIQVFSDERWLRAVAIAHIVTGVVFAVGLLAHQVVAQRGKRIAAKALNRGDRRPRSPRRTGARRLPS